MLDTALLLNSLDMVPVVIPPGQKGPRDTGWQNRRYTADELPDHFRRGENVGVLLGKASGIIAFDCDTDQAKADLLDLFDGNMPITPEWESKRGGQLLFAWDDRLSAIDKAVTHWREVEVRLGCKAAQSVLPPSTTDGFTRKWIRSLADCPPAKLPDSVIAKLLAGEPSTQSATQSAHTVNRIEDDFSRHPNWQFLVDAGWQQCGQHFTRPGKSDGTSASIEKISQDGIPLLHVFTSHGQPSGLSARNARPSCLS